MKSTQYKCMHINAEKSQILKRMICFALTHVILQYSISISVGLDVVVSNRVLKDQKSIVKIILKKKPKTYPSMKIFEEFKVFSTQRLYFRNAL